MTNHTSNKTNEILGKVITATITKVDYDHIILTDSSNNRIKLDNHSVGPKQTNTDLRLHLNCGEKLQVFIRKQASSGIYYGNSDLAEEDPWNQKYLPKKVGDTVAGQIVHVSRGAAFVRLNCGLNGFLSRNDFLDNHSESMRLHLEAGDWVKAKVYSIDTRRFSLNISVNELNARIMSKETKFRGELNKRTTIADGARITINHKKSSKRPEHEFVGLRVLIVDDRADVLYPFAGYLSSLGIEVETAEEVIDTAMKYIYNNDYDFLFIDHHLADGSDGEYLIEEAYKAKRLASKGVYMYTGQTNDQIDSDWLKEHGVTDLLSKPLSSETILNILRNKHKSKLACQNAGQIEDDNAEIITRVNNAVFQMKSSDFNILQFNFTDALHDLREEAKNKIDWQALAIFKIDELGRNINIFYSEGIEKARLSSGIEKITYTPVMDIFGRQEEIRLDSSNSRQFEHLLELLPNVSAIIGFPIKSCGRVNHCLVFFRYNKIAFPDHQFEHGQTLASKLSLMFERENIRRLYEKELIFSVLGRLMTGLNHELNNNLNTTLSLLPTLEEKWRQIKESPEKLTDFKTCQTIDNLLNQTSSNLEGIRRLVELFITPISGAESEKIELVAAIHDQMRLVDPEAKAKHIRLVLASDQDSPKSILCPRLALAQIMTNLLLNAIQQLDKKLGVISVIVSYQPEKELPICIDVRDNGPGIPTRNHERIFEQLFTTKKKGVGMGMGLYIARNLALSNGGTLELLESYMKIGSTFRLRLPHILIGGNA